MRTYLGTTKLQRAPEGGYDMDAVFALADRISVLFYGQILVTGTVDEIRRNPVVREAYLGHDERNA